MKKEVSLYLDAVRFVAAMVVFIDHFSTQRINGGFLWQFRAFGNEAVTAFFVLSGFVIAYATTTRETTPLDYCVSRMARMYSVAIPALLLTIFLDVLGASLHPEAYAKILPQTHDFSFARFLTGLTFTNELWTQSVPQGSNAPYWSMGYEVPYYVIFGIAVFAPVRWRIAAVLCALAAVGPSILVALPIWATGVLAFHICKRDVLSARLGKMLFIGSILAWLVYEVIVWRYGRPLISASPWHKRIEIVQDYFIATFFAVNVIGLNAAAKELSGPILRFANPIRAFASASFTLYLCHYPIMQFVSACMPWPNEDPRSRTIVFSTTLLIIFLLARVTEQKKAPWKRAVMVLLGGRKGVSSTAIR